MSNPAAKKTGRSTAALSNAQRQAKLRRDRDAAGLVEVRNLWAHPGDVDAIRQHARDLAVKRAAAKAAG